MKKFIFFLPATFFYYSIIAFSFFLLTACSQVKVEPDLLISSSADQLETKFPPTKDDLTYRKRYILPLLIEGDEMISNSRKKEVLSFLSQAFLKMGDIYTIAEQDVITRLTQENFQGFQAANIPEALLLGQELQANYLSQIRIAPKKQKNKNSFKAGIDLSVFSVGSGQLAFREIIPYDAKSTKRGKKALKKLIQSYFPIKGFILETRGDHQVAKISVGRSAGVKLKRTFLIHERKVKSELVQGIMRKTNSFSDAPVASGKVIQVMENESWILIKKKERPNVLKGQVVFAKPEKSGMFD